MAVVLLPGVSMTSGARYQRLPTSSVGAPCVAPAVAARRASPKPQTSRSQLNIDKQVRGFETAM
jgi:hypothetical protein